MRSKSIIFCFIILLCCLCCTGCVSTGGLQGKDAELIEANSRNLGRIESTVSTLDSTIESSYERLGIVARASERIKDASERLDYLFTEYEHEVQRLIEELYRLRNELETREKGEVDRVDSGSGGSTDNSSRDNSGS